MQMDTPRDIVSHYPFRYENVRETPYDTWKIDEKVIFEGRFIKVASFNRFRGKNSRTVFEVLLENEEVIRCTIFNRPWFNKIESDSVITVFGRYDGNNRVTCTTYNTKPLKEQEGIIPVYNLKEGVQLRYFRNIMKKTLENTHFEDIIPESYRTAYRLLNKDVALREIHFPSNEALFTDARRTLKYEEFLVFSIIMQMRRASVVLKDPGYSKQFNKNTVDAFIKDLPFALTEDQNKTINEILSDMQEERAMYRLVQGDVGCGKTVVAMTALYANYLSGHQGAFMAPTEILAQQQYSDMCRTFAPYGIRVRLLTSSLSSKEKRETLEQLADGSVDIAVGTHALIQENVVFSNLGLIVTDEQHRFGVNQRKALFEKGQYADFLVMSATPIPRTLANVLYGDMDLSVIETLPPGRKPVKTALIRENSIRLILNDLMKMLDNKDRCYIICPAIESDSDSMKNVTDIYESLNDFFKGRYRLAFLHGKMDNEEKQRVMDAFKDGTVQILVSTTVVEVGVNVKEANIMIVYNADRFGLSQLHQLRGRIKRGNKQGYCYLLTDSKDPLSLKRLEVLSEHENGFEIAEYDLKLRGPGDMLGLRQSGLPSFNLGDIETDGRIIKTAMKDARDILSRARMEEVALLEYCDRFVSENDGID